MIIIEFCHRNHYIYRDLRPSNIMIDENKTVVLIDFDHMITDEYKSNTIDLQENFVAPEVNQKKSTFKSDVYSIGKIIEFMFKNEI